MTERLVEDERGRTLLVNFIQNQKLPFRANIKDGRDRSIEQNRLMWMWAAEAGGQRGMTAGEQQHEWKLLYGIPLLLAENDTFAKVWRPLEGTPYAWRLKWMEFIDVTSIMTTKQMAHFLETVLRKMTEDGIELTIPEDLRWGGDNALCSGG